MPYATSAQLQAAAGGAAGYVQVFDWDADGSADSAVVAELQAEVDAWIDGYIGTRFAVPVADASGMFARCSAEEVVYRARVKRNMVTDDHRREHDERLSWLRDVAKGLAVPADPQPSKASSSRSAWVDRNTDAVSRDSLKGSAW
jgi:phage gp36-like protein